MEHEDFLSEVLQTVPRAQSVEELTRPLLDALSVATKFETTYLTTIDLDAGIQHVQFALNKEALQIPEGLDVPWRDTLCKRALDEHLSYTDDVSGHWGDSDAARALGIQTYLSVPVRTQEGELLGTLCAASMDRKPLTQRAQPLLQLFSYLIGRWVERELLVEKLRVANAQLANQALIDVLTGLPNRRAVVDELGRLLARAKRDGQNVMVGLIDLDGFKAINDTYGHLAGDRLLAQVAQRMHETLRSADLLGRVGGDEFVVLAPGPYEQATTEAANQALQCRLAEASIGTYDIGTTSIDYGGASVGVVAIDPLEVDAEGALRLADSLMYQVKKARKVGRQ
ncbi:MAG TPA: sensor domain-containing diguanylate cyclase [Castellaniella sp.]|uniref:sensor domain-containing diguanylate cyclase n=1 Tax=Castellaniella sp. TaxID=1955812 RepID=UPI002EF60B74